MSIKYLTPTELQAVLREAKKQGRAKHLAFLLGYRHGLRSSEIAGLKLSDLANGQISVRRVKQSLHTIQPLESHENPLFDEKRALAAYMRERGQIDSVYLFTSPRSTGKPVSRRQVFNWFQDIAYRAGIDAERRHCHVLKHALGRHMAEKNVPLYHIQKALGHRHITSTEVYLSISDREASGQATQVVNSLYA
jgi:integrase